MSEQDPTRPRAGAPGAEPAEPSEPDTPESDETVRQRLESLRRDPEVRWHMSPHTLELAISALAGDAGPAERPRAPGKSRRRRKRKRFL